MSIAIVMPGRSTTDLANGLGQALNHRIPIQIWPEINDLASVRMVVSWKHQPGSLAVMENLQGICSYGAGVDHLWADPALPDVALGRFVDASLKRQIAGYVCACLLPQFREFPRYRVAQARQQWQPQQLPARHQVGILGAGEIGQATGEALAAAGCGVEIWARGSSERNFPVREGEEALKEMAAECDALVCALPLTSQTHGRLNKELFSAMRRGAILVNIARGGHLVEQDLPGALDSGQLRYAFLDVFDQEPLPGDHPFWTHPKIRITPHIAALTDPSAAAVFMARQFERLESGEGFEHKVDRHRGY